MEDSPTIPFSSNNKVQLFISYSSKDTDLMNELLTQLKVLAISDNQIEFWQDGLLEPGIVWDREIKEKLHAAQIVLMLVSASFLTSEYVLNIEIRDTLLKQEKGEVSAIPVILKPCAWQNTPLSKFQVLPRKGIPVTQYPDRDIAWLEVVTGVQSVIKKWKTKFV